MQTKHTPKKRNLFRWLRGECLSRLLIHPLGQSVYRGFKVLRAFGAYQHRKQLFNKFYGSKPARIAAENSPLEVPASKGYLKFSGKNLPGLAPVLETCREIYDARKDRLPEILAGGPSGKYFLADLIYDDDLTAHPELVEFALSEPILAMASRYLGTIPVLHRVGLYLSSNQADDEDDLIRSQLFHQDGEDSRQLKFFINVLDITEDDGPFTFLPADVSQAVENFYRQDHGGKLPLSGRYEDEELFPYCTPVLDLVQGTGEAGNGIAVDTSRCYHYGSRLKKGRIRLCFYLQFLKYHYLRQTPFNIYDVKRFGTTPVRQLALTHPKKKYKPQHFFRNPLTHSLDSKQPLNAATSDKITSDTAASDTPPTPVVST